MFCSFSPKGDEFRPGTKLKEYLKTNYPSAIYEDLIVRKLVPPTPVQNKKKVATKTKPSRVIDEEDVLFYDPKLPEGWTRQVTKRKSGVSIGKWDVYIKKYNNRSQWLSSSISLINYYKLISPEGKPFRSWPDLEKFLKKEKSQLNHDDFDFSIRGIKARKQITPTPNEIHTDGKEITWF